MMISRDQESRRVTPSIAAGSELKNFPIMHRHAWPALASAALVLIANVLAITGYDFPFIGPAIGFWFIALHPTYLLYTTTIWRGTSVAERVGYSLSAVLLLLMLAGLAINAILPLLDVQRPLDSIPVVILVDILTISLYLFRRKRAASHAWRVQIMTMAREESRLIVGAIFCVVVAVLGTNRLNNGAGDQVSLIAMSGIVLTLIFLLRWQGQVRDGIVSVTVYFLSLALLLMTSLRGWYVTGHDIQGEYRVFQLTEAHGRWNISYFHDAYNACLSITILPTELAQVVHVDGPYIYKLVFQTFFALCPVLVYAISRRYFSKLISILAVIYFIGFPSFFTDFPFLNRQEVAFLFVCIGILSITNIWWGPRRRRLALFIAALGVELSHYSTMYLFLSTLLVAWMAQRIGALSHWRRPPPIHAKKMPWAVMARTVGIGSVVVVAAITFAWGELATQTAGPVLVDAESTVSGLMGHSSSVRSDDVTYGLVSGKAPSSQALLNSYRQETIKAQDGPVSSTYVSPSILAHYQTPIVSQPPLPPTSVGDLLSKIGIPVGLLNEAVRQGAAKGEQAFAGVGLLIFVVVRRRRRLIGQEYFYLCVGSIAIVTLITILPDLSVDYGVLRAFQEALILIAPILVVGSIAAFSFLGHLWATRLATLVAVGVFVSTIGLLPQVLGDYPAQLSLNNSGLYYDIYYTHPQEVAAVNWLAGKPGVLPSGIQAESFTNRFYFTSPSEVSGQQVITDIYPSVVRQSSWLILGYSTLRTGRATTYYDGDLLTYIYPIGFLKMTKNLIYNNGGAEIYK
jgi:uncharacterized membrane protein